MQCVGTLQRRPQGSKHMYARAVAAVVVVVVVVVVVAAAAAVVVVVVVVVGAAIRCASVVGLHVCSG
jgi:hypothetical protein